MSIKYKMVHREDYLNPSDNKKSGYYPQVVRSKTIGIDDLALAMSKGKRLQAIDAKNSIMMLLACIEDELLDGNNVCLDEFGTFSLSAQCKRVAHSPNEVRAESIEVKRITFKTSAPLRKRLKNAEFTKI